MRVALLGLGRMGRPMAANLARAGHELVVWNRTRARAESVKGAAVARTPAEAAAGAAVVVTILADDAAVESVVLGPDGVAAGLAPGAVHAGMSTVSVACSRRLAAAHAERGQRYVAAPVFGRPDAAGAGRLWIVAGGPADAVAACRPVFDVLGQGVVEVGAPAERANVVKLAGNVCLAAAIEAMAETFALVRAYGVPADTFHDLLANRLFRSPIYQAYGELIRTGRYEPAGFALRHGWKDMRYTLAAADEATLPTPLASLLRDRFLAAAARGWADADWAALGRLAADDAGARGRPDTTLGA